MTKYPLYKMLAKKSDPTIAYDTTELSATLSSITTNCADAEKHDIEINFLIHYHFVYVEGCDIDDMAYDSRYRSPKLKKTQIFPMENFPIELIAILYEYAKLYTEDQES
jgi:hypothetical protein